MDEIGITFYLPGGEDTGKNQEAAWFFVPPKKRKK